MMVGNEPWIRSSSRFLSAVRTGSVRQKHSCEAAEAGETTGEGLRCVGYGSRQFFGEIVKHHLVEVLHRLEDEVVKV